MSGFVKIAFAVMAFLEMIMLIGTKEKDERKSLVVAYVTTIAGIVALFVIDLAVVLCL